MLSSLRVQSLLEILRSTQLHTTASATTRVATPQLSLPTLTHPYFLPRNTRGNLPVYTDIRNAGSRYLVLIRNIDGNVNMLARDLADTLFERDSSEANRMKIRIVRSKNLVISGGRWKNNVVEWLQEKGF